MKKLLFIFILALSTLFFVLPGKAIAQTPEASGAAEITPVAPAEIPQDEYSKAKVIEVKDEQTTQAGGFTQPVQKVKLVIQSGSEIGKEIEVTHGELFAIQEEQKVKVGEEIVLVKTQGPTGNIYYITDRYRTSGIIALFVIFFVVAALFGKRRGVSAIAGLVFSVFVLVKFVIPQIAAGQDPLVVSLIAALVIAVISLYMAHGVNRRTSIALASTILTLLISAVLAIVFVKISQLTGTGSEEAVFLRMGPIGDIDLKGLLLGGIIIGALGVLDDITTTQAAAVEELRKANPSLSKRELIARGMSIGREHIASLINTLALAYVGASFPLLLLFSFGGANVPFWLTFNSEFIIEEIVRTLVGSTALILAVPISTFLAAHYLTRETNLKEVAVVSTSRKSVARKPASKAKKAPSKNTKKSKKAR